MEKKRLIKTIAGSMFNAHNIKYIKSVKDFYKDIQYSDVSKIDVNAFTEIKEVLEWIIEHPEYDFNSLFETHYTNQELYNYFKVYYDDILFTLDRYEKKDYIIKPTDFA